MVDMSKLIRPEHRRHWNRRTEAYNAIVDALRADPVGQRLPFARELIRLAMMVRSSAPIYYGLDHGRHYGSAIIGFVIPDMARRLGLSEHEIPEAIRALDEQDSQPIHRAQGDRYRQAVQTCIRNAGLYPHHEIAERRRPEDPKPEPGNRLTEAELYSDAVLAWDLLTDAAEGSLLNQGLRAMVLCSIEASLPDPFGVAPDAGPTP